MGTLTIDVECYAGHRGEQTPRTLILGDRRVTVTDVLDAWLAPDHRYFKLRGSDGATYLVRHDEHADAWELTMFQAEPKLTGGSEEFTARQCRKSGSSTPPFGASDNF